MKKIIEKLKKIIKYIWWVINPFNGATFIDRIMPPGGKRRIKYDKEQTEKNYKERVNNYYKLSDEVTAKYWEGIDHRKYLVYEKNLDKAEKDELTDYEKWVIKNELSDQEYDKQKKHRFWKKPKISIVVPLYNTDTDFFRELLYSVHLQTYSNWELCLADGSKEKLTEIENMCAFDKRIKYKFLNDNKGISGNTNEAIKMATGEYIALLDHDDMLSLDALYEIVNAINSNKNVDFIYSDEDKFHFIDEPRFAPHFKPDYAPDTLRSNNYICHFSVIKKSLLDKIGLFNSGFDGAQDYDLILRITEKAKTIIHISKILYHWRVHKASTAMNSDAKPYAFEAGKKAIKSHLERINLNGDVHDGVNMGTYVIDYKVNGNPKVEIFIINSHNNTGIVQKCKNTIISESTYKNFEIKIVNVRNQNIGKAINDQLQKSLSDYIIILDANMKLLTKNWIEQLLGYAQRDDVGIVGVKTYYNYSKKRVQNAGIILDKEKGIIELFNNFVEEKYGYFGRENLIQNLNVVSGKCLLFKKKNAEEIGNFSEEYKNNYYDIDFCLKNRKQGKLVLFNPYVKFELIDKDIENTISDEDKNLFNSKWNERLNKQDEYFNINLKTFVYEQKSPFWDIC